MRIDTLSYSNVQTQGAQRRKWLREYSPQHLEQTSSLISHALRNRQPGASPSTLVLGAGACTEVPLTELARASDEVVLVDFDLASMQQGRDELSSSLLRRRVRLVECDLTDGVSANLERLVKKQPWSMPASEDARTIFDAAAGCLEQCVVPDPPELEGLDTGTFGLVLSSLVLSQLFSYPLLDLLDHVQRLAPQFLQEQERHRRYQEAAQAFRLRVIQAHLHLLRNLVDAGGRIILLSDIRGFVFNTYDSNSGNRRTMPLVPRALPDIVRDNFTIKEEARWEWLTDLPEKGKLGRGYEVVGYLLTTRESVKK